MPVCSVLSQVPLMLFVTGRRWEEEIIVLKKKGNTKDLKNPETTHVKAFQKDSTSSRGAVSSRIAVLSEDPVGLGWGGQE